LNMMTIFKSAARLEPYFNFFVFYEKIFSPRKHESEKARNLYFVFFALLSFRAFVIN
jgi:hypothetical protein